MNTFIKYLSRLVSAPTMPRVDVLEAAVQRGDSQAVLKTLHSESARSGEECWQEALKLSVFWEQFGVFEVLLSEVVRVSPDIFVIASETGSRKFVHALLAHGINVNSALTNGTTGMMAAAGVRSELFKFADEVDSILEGEKTHYISPDSSPPISAVSQSYAFKAYHKNMHPGCIDVLKMLSSSGAGANLSNQNGDTALLGAVSCGSVDGVTLLLSSGADVNTSNRYGFSPLIIAAIKGHTEITTILLENGASTTHKDNDGFTASMRVLQHGDAGERAPAADTSIPVNPLPRSCNKIE